MWIPNGWKCFSEILRTLPKPRVTSCTCQPFPAKFGSITFEHHTIFIVCRTTDFSHIRYRVSVLRIQNLIPLLGPPTKKFSTCLLASEPLRPSLFSCYSYVQGTSGSGSLKCWDWARAADIICPMGLGFLSVQMRMGWDQEALLHLWTFYWYRFGVESACISGARKLKVLLRSITYSWSEISSLNGK